MLKKFHLASVARNSVEIKITFSWFKKTISPRQYMSFFPFNTSARCRNSHCPKPIHFLLSCYAYELRSLYCLRKR